MNETIVAIATTLGVGAISIIRISGKNSISIADKIFSGNLKNKKTHTLNYGYIIDKHEKVDEVLVSIMKSPKSFTTEDVVEINCHGGIATTKKVLELLIKNGCRLAEPGEFTKRAFLNGRIDLTEASAVMDLINTKSESARKIAINNLQGKTKNKIIKLRKTILDIISNIEVNIDYPEYLDIEVITKRKIESSLTNIENEINSLIKNSKNSKLLKEGINVSIVGKPNVGKSSLLNKILNEEKAIVTEIPGTTRDIVEGSIIIEDVLFNFVDTAGIRKTSDIVEKIGVNKSLKAMEEADLVILVLNNNEMITNEDKTLLEKTKDKKRIIVVNKKDLTKKIDDSKINDKIYADTISDDGIKELKGKIIEMFDLNEIDTKDFTYVSNIESLNKLESAKESVKSIKQGLKQGLTIDMLEIDLKNIWFALGEIVGETYTDELLDNLFSNFCVGK